MTTQYSTSLRFWEGQQNDPAIANNWGTPIAANFTWIDSAIAGTASVSLTGLTTYSLTTANGAADQSRELVQDYIGALGATCTVTLPNVPKIGWARNDTTGGHTVIETAGAGTTATIGADGYWYFRATDGATNALLPNVAFGAAKTVGGLAVGTTLSVTGASTLLAVLTVKPSNAAPTGVLSGDGSTYISVGTTSAHPFLFVTSNIERARFDPSGNLLFATTNTSPVTANVTGIIAKSVPGASAMVQISNPAGSGLAIGTNTSGATLLPLFYGGVQVASISMVGSGLSVAYNTGSDYRIKVTYGPADTGAVIDAVPVHDAAFLADPSVRRPMFLAHELQAAAPWAVHGDKDAVDENGAIVLQQVDHPSLVPTLWAELQSLRRRVAELERRPCQPI